jgi:hypothetical protein
MRQRLTVSAKMIDSSGHSTRGPLRIGILRGWLGPRIGRHPTTYIGMGVQVVALRMRKVPGAWLSVTCVMCAQAPSGAVLSGLVCQTRQ